MAIKTQKIVGDFETTTTPDDVRVWAACAVDIETLETVHIGNSIEGFMDWLYGKNTVCYFHNLKFDGEFILHYLLTHGYKITDRPREGCFETLITDTGVFYTITVYYKKLNKKWLKTTFYDSMKKLPFKVATIAKAFNLGYNKLSIDYDAPRPVGHELTKEERDYVVVDCRIVAEALQIQFSQGLKKMTNASDAMNDFKARISRRYFESLFPVFPVPLDADIRRAYKGGFVYLNPKYRNARVPEGITLDVNSLYPSVMYNELLPYGYPIYFEGEPDPDENFPLYIVRVHAWFKLKPGHIPCIQLKNNRAFVETEYLTSSNNEIVPMTLTSVDLALIQEHYDFVVDCWECGWRFKGKRGIFKDYIDYWGHIKETTTGALRQLAKLQLNSLYGKFATNPKAAKKVQYLDADGIVRHEPLDAERAKKYGLEEPELRDPVYTAMGAFITAYARDKTIRAAQTVYDRFIYADTDSLHLTGYDIPEGLDIHPTRLGAWKHEGRFTDSKYIRAKTYMETMHEVKKDTLREYCTLMQDPFTAWMYREPDGIHAGITKVTCAGMPDNCKKLVNYDNFAPGQIFPGKLVPRRYPGGIVLTDTNFTIH